MCNHWNHSRQMQNVGIIKKKDTSKYLPYIFLRILLHKARGLVFHNLKCFGIICLKTNLWQDITSCETTFFNAFFNNLASHPKKHKSFLNMFLFFVFHGKLKQIFSAMFVCCCGGAPPCDWQLCQAARRCDYSISPFCPFFCNHHQSYYSIVAQFCTCKAVLHI